MAKTRFTDLTLILTERCNLRCGYCYVPKQERQLPLALAVRGCDWLLGQAPAGREPSISFFGGEPLLAEADLLAIMAHARARRPGLRFMAPTNGTLLDEARLARLRAAGLDLAISLDAAAPAPGATPGKTLEGVRPVLGSLRELSPIVRMTVTPDNVGSLFETIVTLFGAGLHRIMHQPALEEPWPAAAQELWRGQHQRLIEWMVERYQARQPLPYLSTLEGISQRLSGRAAGYCGAGVSNAALDVEGRLFGCYRSVYDPHPERLVLGDLQKGWFNEPLLAAYARLDPRQVTPEEGSCRACSAREACTIYCPALGHALLGDLRGVPADACRLLRIQVELCAEAHEQMRRADQGRRRSVGAHVAAAALALGLSASAAACDSRPAPASDAAVEGMMPGLCDRGHLPDQMSPGLCHPPIPDAMVPGLCDAPNHWPDQMGPGLCPPPIPDGMIGPGLCPHPIPDGMTPGLCHPPIPDGMIGPGLCPIKVDLTPAKPDLPAPGLCPPPMPGLCPIKVDGGQ